MKTISKYNPISYTFLINKQNNPYAHSSFHQKLCTYTQNSSSCVVAYAAALNVTILVLFARAQLYTVLAAYFRAHASSGTRASEFTPAAGGWCTIREYRYILSEIVYLSISLSCAYTSNVTILTYYQLP